MLRKPAMALTLLEKGSDKIKSYDNIFEFADDMWSRFGAVIRMIAASVRGRYSGFSKKNIVLALAAVIYFVAFWDLIPDFLPLIGIMDDAALVAWLLNTINEELTSFLEWENSDHAKELSDIDAIEQGVFSEYDG